jgi:hypothetical protein
MADSYHLAPGPHRRSGGGRCAMEWVAHLAGEEHSDAPRTVTPVLAAFARSWNDSLDDGARQRLRPYLGRTIGTAGDGLDEWRAWLCADWLVRSCAPALLEHAGLPNGAAALRRVAPLVGDESARRADLALSSARAAAARARGEARGEVRAAGTARARGEACGEVRAAGTARVPGEARGDVGAAAARGAGEATASIIVDGARYAARVVPRTVGSDAARAAIRASSVVAAEAVAEAACRVVRDAAWAAAWRDAPAPWPAMRPVAEAVQGSAFGLLDRMLPGELLGEPPVVAVAAA